MKNRSPVSSESSWREAYKEVIKKKGGGHAKHSYRILDAGCYQSRKRHFYSFEPSLNYNRI